MVKLVILVSGKRKSGKDFCSEKLRTALSPLKVSLYGVSHSLKAIYARNHGLDYHELITDGAYKELHRLNMIKWGERIRSTEPDFFCRATIPSTCNDDVVIISDCRRPSDIEYFKSNYPSLTIRIEASTEERERRGFVFVKGIDDMPSECGLDSYVHDIVLRNDTSCNLMDQIDGVILTIRQLIGL